MIERFQFYLDENLAKKESPDKIESESLMEKAFQRINFIKIQDINEITSTFIIFSTAQ